MPERDRPQMTPSDLGEALALLTRLPAPAGAGRGALSAWAWPMAGLAVGLITGLVAVLAFAIGFPAGIAAGLALVASVMVTGAMHEDGLADCADGFWGGTTPQARLEIMKDSHIGSFGTIALVLVLLLRWHAMSLLLFSGWVLMPVIAAAVLSRVPMAAIMSWLPPAREDGLSAGIGQPSRDTAILGGVAGMLVALVLTGFAGLAAAALVGAAALAIALFARSKIGGQTGDALGVAQQIGEVAALSVFAALAI